MKTPTKNLFADFTAFAGMYFNGAVVVIDTCEGLRYLYADRDGFELDHEPVDAGTARDMFLGAATVGVFKQTADTAYRD